MEGTIAEIRMFAGNFPPMYWQFCQGQLLPITQYTPLFALIGTMYGGNGIQTFALPDLRGRIPIGTGQGSVIQDVEIGEIGGGSTVSLTVNELPSHNHNASGTVTPKAGTGKIQLTNDPTGNFNGQTSSDQPMYTSSSNAAMGSSTVNVQVGTSGSNNQFSIMQPYLGMNCVICLEGIFPSRE